MQDALLNSLPKLVSSLSSSTEGYSFCFYCLTINLANENHLHSWRKLFVVILTIGFSVAFSLLIIFSPFWFLFFPFWAPWYFFLIDPFVFFSVLFYWNILESYIWGLQGRFCSSSYYNNRLSEQECGNWIWGVKWLLFYESCAHTLCFTWEPIWHLSSIVSMWN